MPDNIATEEEAKKIIGRWNKNKQFIFVVLRMVSITMFVSVIVLLLKGNKRDGYYLAFMLLWFLLTASSSVKFLFLGEAVRNLNNEELILLENMLIDSRSGEAEAIKEILTAYSRTNPAYKKVTPQKELLRAATYTEEKAQEQLLRPSTEEKII